MGLFSFLKSIGKKVMPGREADEIKADISSALGSSVKDLVVDYADGTVTLNGTVESVAVKEKAILLAGNVESVEQVSDNLVVVVPAPAPRFYTIEKGDSLSKIAKEYYGDPMKYKELFEANREVIKDPDLIYPGQQIRVPHL